MHASVFHSKLAAQKRSVMSVFNMKSRRMNFSAPVRSLKPPKTLTRLSSARQVGATNVLGITI